MTKPKTKYQLLTFYKFVDIDNPHDLVKDHKQFCSDIGMKGRIYIGEEGISATATGNMGQVKAYMLYLDSIPVFSNIPDIEEKACYVDGHKFDKMIVRYRKEIVALGERYSAEEIKNSKKLITVDKFKEIIDNQNDDYVIIDMRNNYEYELGHFKNALPAGTKNFRDLDELLNHYKNKFEGKKLITYCTGGIRCEKAAVKLIKTGISDVYQLDGGIVKYLNKFNDGNWLGNLYTFDGRISCDVGDDNTHTIIAKCHYSEEPAETFYNCRYGQCNAQIIAKPKQYRKHFGFCSEECMEKALEDLQIRNDTFDPMDYKMLRGKIKQNPEKQEEISNEIRNHIRKHTANLEFKIKTPKKEELIYI